MKIEQIKTVGCWARGRWERDCATCLRGLDTKVILPRCGAAVSRSGAGDDREKSGSRDQERKAGGSGEGDCLARLQPVTEMRAIAAADFVVEAVPEKNGDQARGAERSGQHLAAGSDHREQYFIHSMTTLAALTKRPDRFVGMHFMNPVPVMALVEVIRALQTSDATFETTMRLAEKLEKKPVAVNDAPGFVSNRVLMPLINEAAYCVMEGVATPEAVDAVMKAGYESSDGAAGAGGFHRAGYLRGCYASPAGRSW